MYIFMFTEMHIEKYKSPSHPQAVNIIANRNSALILAVLMIQPNKMVLIVLSNKIM